MRWVMVPVVAAFGLVGCGSSDSSSSSDLSGRLLFSRFNENTHTFVSTHTSRPDGGEETAVVLPGPEGGGRWSRSGTHIAVMTILDDNRIGTAIITNEIAVEWGAP